MAMMEAFLAGDGSIEGPNERATFLCLSLFQSKCESTPHELRQLRDM